jgi:hypothetical protein
VRTNGVASVEGQKHRLNFALQNHSEPGSAFRGFDYLSQTREILAILNEEVAFPGLISHWAPLVGTAQVPRLGVSKRLSSEGMRSRRRPVVRRTLKSEILLCKMKKPDIMS